MHFAIWGRPGPVDSSHRGQSRGERRRTSTTSTTATATSTELGSAWRDAHTTGGVSTSASDGREWPARATGGGERCGIGRAAAARRSGCTASGRDGCPRPINSVNFRRLDGSVVSGHDICILCSFPTSMQYCFC
jgi:hypothetical protein